MTCDRHFGWPYAVDLSTQLDISLPSNFPYCKQDVGGIIKLELFVPKASITLEIIKEEIKKKSIFSRSGGSACLWFLK